MASTPSAMEPRCPRNQSILTSSKPQSLRFPKIVAEKPEEAKISVENGRIWWSDVIYVYIHIFILIVKKDSQSGNCPWKEENFVLFKSNLMISVESRVCNFNPPAFVWNPAAFPYKPVARKINQNHAGWFETFSSQADIIILLVFTDLYHRSDVHIDYTQIHPVTRHVHRSCPPSASQLLHSLTPKSASAPGFHHNFSPSHARLRMEYLELI